MNDDLKPENGVHPKQKLRSKGESRCIPLFCFLIWIRVFPAGAQIPSDTSGVERPTVKTPAGAVLRSLVLPGWGQWYNEQKLKAVLVFGAEAAMVGNIVYYHQKAIRSVDASERAFYEDYRSQFVWYLAGVHLLSLLDAYVDANLLDFDTGPDLTDSGMGETIQPSACNLSLTIPLNRAPHVRDRKRISGFERKTTRRRKRFLSREFTLNECMTHTQTTDPMNEDKDDTR